MCQVVAESEQDYPALYSHLQREYRELCRAHQLLQTRAAAPPSQVPPPPRTGLQSSLQVHQDVEREVRQARRCSNKLEAAETRCSTLH